MRPVYFSRYIFSFIFIFSCFKLFAAAPTDIDLSNNTVAENQPINTVVGTLTTTDPDGDLTFTYSLVLGPGSGDNGSFNILGDQLRTSAVFDFETKSSYSIRIRTNDGTETYDEVFIISVTNVNEAPSDITLSANSIAENLAMNTLVGTLTTTDPDGDLIFTYSLVSGTGSTDNASFAIVGNQLRTNAVFDFETKSSYSIRVQTSDAGLLTYQEVFSITVTNVNENPTDIILSSEEVGENQPINTVVGTLSSLDPDGDFTFTYSLVGGPGSSDNSNFNIFGNQLRTSTVFDSDTKPTCQIRIRTMDVGGLSYDEQFIITITDVNEPPVLTGIETSPLLYTEDDAATIITSSITVTDPENGNMVSATVSIVGGFNASEDRLSLLVSPPLSVNINNPTGILTITGSGTIAAYQNALRNVRYANINDRDPSVTNRTVQFIINDGAQNSAPVSRVIQITAVNDPPDVLDDAYGGVLEGSSLSVGAASGVLANDEDLDGPISMVAMLQDDVQFGSLTLSSNGSFIYQHDGSNNLVDGFTYYAFDGEDNSTLATVTITMIGANDPPELTGIETTVLTYNEDDPPRQVTATLVVSDEDNLNLQSALVRIDQNFVSSEDLLSYTTNPALTVDYTPSTGIINVSGSATLLIYQNFLRSIRYVNTNILNPSMSIRRITFTVNDGTNNSVAVYRYVQVIPQNDPPEATNANIVGTNFHIGELLTANYTFTDPDGDLEGNTTFRWYMADDNQGTGRTLINTSQKDTLTPLFVHGGKWIQFVVRPYDINGQVGIYDTSEFRYINAAPVLNNFSVINAIHPGAFAVDEIVRADYTYFDKESNPQGTHTYQWYRSNSGSWLNKQPIFNADKSTYTITENDNEKYIGLEAVAYATAGSSPGQVQQSQWHLVSEIPSAIISGDIEICEGATDFVSVSLTGNNPPWSFRYVIEGTTDTIPVNNIPAGSSNYLLEVSEEGTYLLVDVSDQEFDFGIVTGTGSVTFFPLPTAELTVDELSICDNDIGIYTMPVQLSGNAPWSLSYKILGEPDSSFVSNIDATDYEIEFTVDDLGTYRILHVWDANCMALGTGTTDVILRENPKAALSGDATVCPGDTSQITVDLSGNGPWTFYYTLDDGDEISVDVNHSVPSYKYIMEVDQPGVYRLVSVENNDQEGCAYGTATIENFVQPSATITGEFEICEGASTNIPVTLTGTSPWTITYQHNIDEPVTVDFITQNPYLLKVSKDGSYSIEEVTDGNDCAGSGSGLAEITVNPAPDVNILNLGTIYTIQSPPIPLEMEPEGGNFDLSDPGVFEYQGNMTFWPLIAGSENSPHLVIYSYQDAETGCFGRDTVIVSVLEAGGVIEVKGETGETPESYCFNSGPMILEGVNQGLTLGTFSISGSSDALQNLPSLDGVRTRAYLFPSKIQSGQRTVTYSYEISGQPDQVTRIFNFEKVTADFTWDNECFTTQALVTLSDQSTASSSDIDSNKWEIRFSDHLVRADTTILNIEFDAKDTYPIEYVTITKFGCSDTARKELILRPTYVIHDDNYVEDFSDGKSDWDTLAGDNESPVSWTFGAPNGETIKEPYERAWFTSIKNPLARENSYVMSPCFDFSDAERPMIKMNIWRDFVTNLDGTMLQYKTDSSSTWYSVGNVGEGINWFNSSTIQGIPGGNGTGWTSALNRWETVKHKLDNIPTDEGFVRFRMAYGAPSNVGDQRDGFAFDSIWIGERTKRVLVEHFTNMGIDATIKEVDSLFNEIVNKMEKDVIDIQYHMGRPGNDEFYDYNNNAPDTRDWFYSLPSVPYGIIDGGRGNDRDFLIDYSSEKLKESDLDVAVLEDNKFDIQVTPTKGGDYVNIDVKVTALENMGQKYITVHIVIIENEVKDVVSDFGESHFESVVRDMLPEPVGTSYNINWMAGTFRNINLDYYFDDITDEKEIRIVVFVQDNGSHEVFQAAMVPAEPIDAIENDVETNKQFFKIYPNPASEFTHVLMMEPLPRDAQIQVSDNSGRLIRIVELNQGDKLHSIQLDEFEPGLYHIRLLTDQEILGSEKLIVLGNK